ncbi:hypothetical protein G0U57_005582 [Chelydra serpentina]|uniref:Uncharacterized protein n=1 Tax=Chelydra serpentina TaxID=8475 RepID=A0A8T1RZK2_CHESE|nr:hypothetical protein G0U57_005582 [Chelydra serpentina]
MFSELMKSYSTERAQQNAWRQTMAESMKVLNERDERRQEHDEMRQDAILKLMGEQTDMLRSLVQLQERQQEQSPPLQPRITACTPPQVPYPSHPDAQEHRGEAPGTQPLHPRGLPKQQKAGI